MVSHLVIHSPACFRCPQQNQSAHGLILGCESSHQAAFFPFTIPRAVPCPPLPSYPYMSPAPQECGGVCLPKPGGATDSCSDSVQCRGRSPSPSLLRFECCSSAERDVPRLPDLREEAGLGELEGLSHNGAHAASLKAKVAPVLGLYTIISWALHS